MKQLRVLARRLSILSAVVALGLTFSPATAHAATIRSKTGNDWGPDRSVAAARAESAAYWALYDFARSLGETCTGVTYSNVDLVYIIPSGGGYVFSATATGTCA
jgi:hypothetical protein